MSVFTGKEKLKLGFGLMRLPKNEDGSIDIPQTSQMVDRFIEAGGTYFDTAFAYPGSEEAIRQALVVRYPRDSYTLATKLMALMGISIFFYSIVQLTNAVMQAHGRATLPVINMLLAGVVRLIVVYILTGNPHIQLLAAPIGGVLCYLCIAVMNLIAMGKVIPHRPAVARNMLRPLIPTVVMGAAAFGVWYGLKQILDATATTGKLLLCAVPVLVGVVVYFALVIMLKSITREDCLLLPKGEKIADILHL